MNRKQELQNLLDSRTDADKPVEISFTDGTTEVLPTLREMIQAQMDLEDQFEAFMADPNMWSKP